MDEAVRPGAVAPEPQDVAINFPLAASTTAFGINDTGEIAGYYTDAAGNTHGFVYALRPSAQWTLQAPAVLNWHASRTEGLKWMRRIGWMLEPLQRLPDPPEISPPAHPKTLLESWMDTKGEHVRGARPEGPFSACSA